MKAASVGKAKKYKPKKQPLKKRLVRYWPLYLMLLPCIIYYALICYVPMANQSTARLVLNEPPTTTLKLAVVLL